MEAKETAQLEHTVVSTINYAKSIIGGGEIQDPAQYSIVGNNLAAIKTKTKELTEMRFDMTRPLDESKKRIISLFNGPLDALAEAEKYEKGRMIRYTTRIAEEERKRKEEAARETARLAAEARKKEEEAIRLAIEASSAEEAQAASVAMAQAKELAVVAAEPVMHLDIAPKARGVATKEIWKFEIVDESLIPREWLVPDLVKIGTAARGAKDAIKIPGVRIYSETIVSARSY